MPEFDTNNFLPRFTTSRTRNLLSTPSKVTIITTSYHDLSSNVYNMHHPKLDKDSIPSDVETDLDEDVEPSPPTPAADSLGYRQEYLKNLADTIPSKKGSVSDVRTFVRSVLEQRQVAHETVESVTKNLLWTGEELHQLNRDDLVRELQDMAPQYQEYTLAKSQAGLIAKDIIDARKVRQKSLFSSLR